MAEVVKELVAAVLVVSPAGPAGETEPLVREKEKHEKKKKPKHSDDSDALPAHGLGMAGGAAGSTAIPGSMPHATGSTSRSHAAGGAGLSVNDFISKTKNQQRQGLKPSGPELVAYARYLGIDPVADHDLLWIAVEALEAPLPSDWTEHFDSNDRVFYYNATVRVSSWTHPLEHIYRETYKTIVNFRNANMSPQERNEKLNQLQLEVKQMETDVHKEIAQWTEHTDEQGNRFYFNREERQSTWTDPRPAKCQILYLRMKMLRLLATGSGVTAGFAESKGDLGSRFAVLGSSELEDPAGVKRPKVGGSLAAVTASSQSGQAEIPDATAQHAADASSPGEPVESDSDSEDDKKKKKKKKKKKEKERKRREAEKPQDGDRAAAAAAPPPLLSQNLRSSQSEPAVGGKPLLGNVEDSRGGMGSLQQSLSMASFDHPEGAAAREGPAGLSTLGRARVKAGIRLDPIGKGL